MERSEPHSVITLLIVIIDHTGDVEPPEHLAYFGSRHDFQVPRFHQMDLYLISKLCWYTQHTTAW